MILGNTEMEIWVKFIKEAEQLACTKLPENLESYLVLLLRRHIRWVHFDTVPFAIQLGNARDSTGNAKKYQLQKVGDASLMMAGFFPERAARLNVSPSYFMEISEMCFHELSIVCETIRHPADARDFRAIRNNIPVLAGTLRAARNQKEYYNVF